MTPAPLLIITTRLPPEVCGIGTYSWLLHRHWPVDGRDVRFLVVAGATKSAAELRFSAIAEFGGQASKLSAILNHTGTTNLLLHYAGRAFHRYGVPFWLPRVLRAWKERFPASRIVVFFHELPGDNFPITSRFFWIDQGNRRIVRHLARLADAVATNTRQHVEAIERLSKRTDVHFIPVGSNIEPGSTSDPAKKRSEFAIFGLPFGRWQTLGMFGRDIAHWQTTGRLTKLHLVGQTDEKFDGRSKQLIEALPRPETVVQHGFLSAADVSRLLEQTQFGLTNCTVENWSKSTTFMAYAAHGCVIVGKTKEETEPLSMTVSTEELATLPDSDLGARATMLRQWYRANADWNSIARQIGALVEGRK